MQQSLSHLEPAAVEYAAAPQVISDDAGELRRILEPGVNLTLLRRPVAPKVAWELRSLRPADLPDVRCKTTPASLDQDVAELLTKQRLDPAAFEHWRADLRRVADLFFPLAGERPVSLRLEATEADGCRRYHVDRTHLRLLCTYRGPGTEWLPDAQVDRDAQRGGAPNEDIVRFGGPSRFEPFWVGVLKGDAYPGNAGRGLVHRSPPIAETGETRLLFCLDC